MGCFVVFQLDMNNIGKHRKNNSISSKPFDCLVIFKADFHSAYQRHSACACRRAMTQHVRNFGG